MRRALARLLSVALTLALTSVVALWALSQLSDRFGRSSELPLYFNKAPRNVHDLSLRAVERLTLGADVAAERELARLGGAALPHVLPKLDSLAPNARGRVALALAPVARRMGIANEDELGKAESAVAFWTRFWQDRSFDFRPQVARRLVSRLAQKSGGLRFDDIVQLDSYPLAEVVQALGTIRGADDVARAARLTSVLSHVTGRGPVVDSRMSESEARAAVRSWQSFIVREGRDFITLDGPSRLVATLAQTRFGAWVGQLLGVLRYRADDGVELGLSAPAAAASATRSAFALLLALVGGAYWARLEGRGSRRLQSLGRLAAGFLAAIPAIFVLELAGAPRAGWACELLAVLLTSALGAALVSRGVRAALSRRSGTPRQQSFRVEWSAAVALVPSVVPWLSSCLFALEFSLDRQGVARETLAALARGEIAAGMSLALAAAFLSILLVTLGDRDVASLRERTMPSLIEVENARRKRTLGLAAASLGLLLVFSVRFTPAETAGWSELTNGARSLLVHGSIALAVAAVVGLALGAAAASGPQALDGFLARWAEVSAGLPALVWAAAFAASTRSGIAVALGLGLVRAIDVAWSLRSELLARARADQELGLRSLGRLPLVTYLRGRLLPASIPALATLALTPAWLVAIQTFAHACTLRATPGGAGWAELLSRPGLYPGVPALAAATTIALVTWLLLLLMPSEPRRLGALRSNTPLPVRSSPDGA